MVMVYLINFYLEIYKNRYATYMEIDKNRYAQIQHMLNTSITCSWVENSILLLFSSKSGEITKIYDPVSKRLPTLKHDLWPLLLSDGKE